MAAPTNVSAMTTVHLYLIVSRAPERRVLWTPFELAASDELDRRAVEAAA